VLFNSRKNLQKTGAFFAPVFCGFGDDVLGSEGAKRKGDQWSSVITNQFFLRMSDDKPLQGRRIATTGF
jgi:hypothetical protein